MLEVCLIKISLGTDTFYTISLEEKNTEEED